MFKSPAKIDKALGFDEYDFNLTIAWLNCAFRSFV
jgi:hypothetical protein